MIPFSCAHVEQQQKLKIKQGFTPNQLFEWACRPGIKNRLVTGTLQMLVESKELNGRFSANAKVDGQDKARVVLEITNPLGGTEAVLKIEGEKYDILREEGSLFAKSKLNKIDSGYGSWGGIPIRWASVLFLGRIPCPDSGTNWSLSLPSPDVLVVEGGGGKLSDPGVKPKERFTYQFVEQKGQPWPEQLKWENLGVPPMAIAFKFDGPESKGMSPTKWEIQSDKGKLKVKWIDFGNQSSED